MLCLISLLLYVLDEAAIDKQVIERLWQNNSVCKDFFISLAGQKLDRCKWQRLSLLEDRTLSGWSCKFGLLHVL